MSQANSSQAYRSSGRLGAGASQTEARALLETARKMDDCIGKQDNIDAYKAALRLNWRLWTIFQADISSAENQLPSDIKQNLLSLSVFIDKHTVNALAEPNNRKLRVLVEINRNIAAGLMTMPEGESAEAEAKQESGTPQQPKPDGDIVA